MNHLCRKQCIEGIELYLLDVLFALTLFIFVLE